MAYSKQTWNTYNDSLSLEENIANDAVITKNKMDHIETGIVDANKPLKIGTVTEGAASATITENGNERLLNLQIPKGNQGPAGTNGANGEQGPIGPKGEPGAKGSNGATWISGSGTPDSSSGKTGDFYLDIASFDIYEKQGAGSWIKQGNIKGADGAPGTNGRNGGIWYAGGDVQHTTTTPTAAPSSKIVYAYTGDMYLNTSSSRIYRCTSPGSPTDALWQFTNLIIKGADGTNGTTGADGKNFVTGIDDPLIISSGAVKPGDTYLNTETLDLFNVIDIGGGIPQLDLVNNIGGGSGSEGIGTVRTELYNGNYIAVANSDVPLLTPINIATCDALEITYKISTMRADFTHTKTIHMGKSNIGLFTIDGNVIGTDKIEFYSVEMTVQDDTIHVFGFGGCTFASTGTPTFSDVNDNNILINSIYSINYTGSTTPN